VRERLFEPVAGPGQVLQLWQTAVGVAAAPGDHRRLGAADNRGDLLAGHSLGREQHDPARSTSVPARNRGEHDRTSMPQLDMHRLSAAAGVRVCIVSPLGHSIAPEPLQVRDRGAFM
jgi:hypothetical protein